jgi:ATP-binding cassette subfamily B protein
MTTKDIAEKTKRESKNWSNFKELLKNFVYFSKLAYQSSPVAFLLFFVLSIISSCFPTISFKIFGNLVDSLTNFIKSGDISNVRASLILYAVVFITPSIIDIFTNLPQNIFYLKYTTYIDIFVLKKRGLIDISHIEDPKFQDLVQQAFNRGNGPMNNLIEKGVFTLRRLLVVVISSFVLLVIDWRIFLLVVVLSLPRFFFEIKFGTLNWSIFQENSREQRVYENLRSFFGGKFSVIESKLFQVQNLFLKKSKEILENFVAKRILLEYTRARNGFFSDLLSTIGMFLGLSLAVSEAIKGSITVGVVVFLFSIISSFSTNISMFLISLADLLENNLYISDILKVINTKPIIKELKNPKKIITKTAPEIEFRNVSFKYPGQKDYVLKNISFKIKPGEKIGLIGHNGAGKTTIIRLLLRIHDPNKGQILINGIDLKNLSLDDWWSKLAILPQDFSTFNFEAKHAISYGDINKPFNIEKVKRAARQSTASDFIESWDDQYERMIGVEFGGAELSKGERQKMALARVFYRDSQIFVLDEPTAAIDSKSTSKIFRSIETISKKQSMLIISHNFATLRRANKIIFLDDGKIIEEGNHDELIQNKKLYSKLYEQQKGEYE